MKEKKNIDRIFQERFKDFEVQPDPKVWEGIERRLDGKKRKRRVIPLWFKVGSVAALLTLLAIIADFYNRPPAIDQQVVDGNNTEEIEINPSQKKPPVLTAVDKTDSVNQGSSQQNRLADSDSQDENAANASENVGKSRKTRTANAVVTVRETGEKQSHLLTKHSDRNKSAANLELDQNAIVAHGRKDSVEMNTKDKAFAENNPNKDQQNNADGNTLTPDQQKTNALTSLSQKDSVNGDGKIDNALANRVDQTKPDSTTQKKSLLELVDQNKEENAAFASDDATGKENAGAKRWSLAPMVAPVYYGSFSGSGIDPQFNGNGKEGDVNLSYGLQVSYAVSDKIHLRSGVNKVNLGYSTNNIGFSAGGRRMAIASINYSGNADVLALSDSPVSNAFSNAVQSFAPEVAVPLTQIGTLEQRLAYYEVPMEMAYSLVDKKIGVQLIGGMSTLFLKQDEILLQNADATTLLGNSNSLNDVSFSTNVGFGLDYNFSESIQFNLEPMFKYQLNAYKNSVQDFKPYYLGLYTGLSIKF